MRIVSIPEKSNTDGNILHDAASRFVEGLTTIPQLKQEFSPGEVIRILSHAEKISSVKPKTNELIEETFADDGLEDPKFETFFEENYMPLVEAHPEQIYKYLDAARRSFKELSNTINKD